MWVYAEGRGRRLDGVHHGQMMMEETVVGKSSKLQLNVGPNAKGEGLTESLTLSNQLILHNY